MASKEGFWLGFDSLYGRLLAGSASGVVSNGCVQPSSALTVVSRPMMPWRGTRLMVRRQIAENFIIHDIRVGHRCSNVSTIPVPACAFITDMDKLLEVQKLFEQTGGVFEMKVEKSGKELLGAPWFLPMAMPGMEVVMTVENIGLEPVRFLAGMLGHGPMLH